MTRDETLVEVKEVERQILREFLSSHHWALMKKRLDRYMESECRQIAYASSLGLDAIRQRQGRVSMLRQLIDTPMIVFGDEQG